MTPTFISVATLMVAATLSGFIWLQGNLAAGSARRRMGMMTRVGLSPEAAGLGNRRTRAILTATRRRCRSCPREDLCDRWLAGEVEGGNAFCPNAQTFRSLMRAAPAA